MWLACGSHTNRYVLPFSKRTRQVALPMKFTDFAALPPALRILG
jgi:hypothetical protein